jgi:hypothetical protein
MNNEIRENEIQPGMDGLDGDQHVNEISIEALPLIAAVVAEVGDLLRALVQGEGAAQSAGDNQARYAAIGLTAKSAERVSRGIRSAMKASGHLASLLMAPGRFVANSRPLRPAKSRFDKLVERGKEEVESWKEEGQEMESDGRQMLRQTVSSGKGQVIHWIGSDPAIEELVKRIADNYIAYLNDHPELIETLIREQGDVYINYLNENPEQVQGLVQGQSSGLVAEVTDQVRERTVTADTLLEMTVRSLFRRGERANASSEMTSEQPLEISDDDTI